MTEKDFFTAWEPTNHLRFEKRTAGLPNVRYILQQKWMRAEIVDGMVKCMEEEWRDIEIAEQE